MSGLISDKSAQTAQIHQTEKGNRQSAFATATGREDVAQSTPSVIHASSEGIGKGLDVLGQTMPQEMNAFNQGSRNAQQATIDGMNMYAQAIKGQPINMPTQPANITYDTSYAQQKLPESITNPDYLRILAQYDPINPFLDAEYTTEMTRRRNEEGRRV